MALHPTGRHVQQLPYNSWYDWAFSPPNATRFASIGSGLFGLYEGYQLVQGGSTKQIVELGVYCLLSVSYSAYLWRQAHHEEQKILENRAWMATVLNEEQREKL